tara:strand:- start:4237 stop:4395 length:159 start_codon:yes stop_codon:yes gene_type:complete
MEKEQTEVRAKIAELRERHAKVQALCSFGARLSPETTAEYAREIQSLEAQLN